MRNDFKRVTSSCLCIKGEGAVLPLLIKSLKNGIDDSLHAGHVNEHHHGPGAPPDFHEAALDGIGGAQLAAQRLGEVQERKQFRQLREEFMKPYGLSMNKLAMDLHVPVTRIAEIVNERRGISADIALRLGRYFRNSAEFWMNMQKHYELEVAKDEVAEKIDRDVRPFEPASTR